MLDVYLTFQLLPPLALPAYSFEPCYCGNHPVCVCVCVCRVREDMLKANTKFNSIHTHSSQFHVNRPQSHSQPIKTMRLYSRNNEPRTKHRCALHHFTHTAGLLLKPIKYYTYAHIKFHIYICVHTHAHVRMHTHTHTYTHAHTHTQVIL